MPKKKDTQLGMQSGVEPSEDTINRIKKAILSAIEKDSSVWMDDLEEKYPKWKGSRVLTKGEDSLTFGFDNTDANMFEVGSPAKPVVGRYIQQVSSHNRRPKGKSKQRIKSHRRVYKNHAPIQLSNGQYRMVSRIPEFKAKKPVSKSATKRYTGKSMEKLIADAIKNEFI